MLGPSPLEDGAAVGRSRLEIATDVVVIYQVISAMFATGRLESRVKQALIPLLIGRRGYQQTSALDLVWLRAQLNQWRKCLTLVRGHIWPIRRSAGHDPAASGIRRAITSSSTTLRRCRGHNECAAKAGGSREEGSDIFPHQGLYTKIGGGEVSLGMRE